MGERVAGIALAASVILSAGCAKFQNFDFYSLPATEGELQYVPYCSQAGAETVNVKLVATQAGARAANIVFVVDTSGSMSNEIDEVRANLDEFVSSIKSTLPAASTRFAVVGDRLNNKEVLPQGYVHNGVHNEVYWHYGHVDSTDKFQKIMRTYGMTTFQSGNNTYNVGSNFSKLPDVDFRGACTNAGSLFNCNALNHIVIVTDDIEKLPNVTTQDQTKNAFIGNLGAWLLKNKNGLRVHAIHGKSASTCSIAKVGTIYEEIAAAMGSLSLDVCTTDWSPLFKALKDNIVASSRAVGFGSCASANRTLVSVLVQWAGGSVTLAPSDYVFTNAAGQGLQASLYVSPATLQAKGVPVDGTPLTLVIESTY